MWQNVKKFTKFEYFCVQWVICDPILKAVELCYVNIHFFSFGFELKECNFHNFRPDVITSDTPHSSLVEFKRPDRHEAFSIDI